MDRTRRPVGSTGPGGPGEPSAAFDRAFAHFKTGRFKEAEVAVRQFLKLHPNHVDATCLLGIVAARLGRNDEALTLLGRVVIARPQLAEAHAEMGDAFFAVGRLAESAAAYRRAIAIKPAWAEAHASLGRTLFTQGGIDEAIIAYREAVRLKPDFADAHKNLGTLLVRLRRYDEAAAAYRSALAIEPELPDGRDSLIAIRMQQCDWPGLETETEQLFDLAMKGAAEIRPFLAVAGSSSPEVQLQVTKTWAAQRYGAIKPRFRHAPQQHLRPRMRLGYLSADLGDHVSAYVTAEAFERHDRSRVEVFAYSLGSDTKSPMRKRLEVAFEHFVDLRALSNEDAAARIHADGIDVLVDMQGYTRDNRTEIMAYRPAPVQVNWLGYAGTMGVDFIDYVLVDRFIVPLSQEKFFSERPAYMPHCYVPCDTTRETAAVTTRTENGLPENRFVFCCFNNAYKITPHMFDIWARIVTAVPDSVLWLLGDKTVKRNLTREWDARGMDPARLVFAPRVPPPAHLARHAHADLFIDTFRYNAHTTAMDALWMGVPVLTHPGETFASRVAGSMLTAIGLPELIADSEADYEALAVTLATQPERLAACRRRLRENRQTMPLFDTAQFTRAMEDTFEGLWWRWLAS